MAKLFSQDLANVERGIYPLPEDHDGSLFTLIDRSRLFFADLPEIYRRRERRAHKRAASDLITISRISTSSQVAG